MLTDLKTDRVIVPAREGRAVQVPAGHRLRVVDVDGGQVGDLFAFAAADPTEYLSASHTRAETSRLFPLPGECFVSDRRRPLLALVADDSPGRHDMLIAACDPDRYRRLGAGDDHPSCAANLRAALATADITPAHVPQPVNLFMDIPVAGDRLQWRPASTRPGAAVTFRALDALVVVLSACPQDLVGINRNGPTSLAIELLGAHT